MTAEALRPIEILLVEDDEGDARLAREALSKGNVVKKVTVVPDGAEALDFLHGRAVYAGARRPDLILLDLSMPKRDGRDVLAAVKGNAELRRIPVVVLTVSEFDQDVLRSYDLHANAYVTKPVDMDQFVEVVRRIDNFFTSVAKLPLD